MSARAGDDSFERGLFMNGESSESGPITLVVVEDDKEFRDRLVAIFKTDSHLRCLEAFGDAEAALRTMSILSPDVVLLDLNLPGVSGLDMIRAAKDRLPSVEIVILTVENDSEILYAALEAGASGYLIKPASAAEITSAVRQVNAGGAPMSPEIARMTLSFFRKRGEAKAALDVLTARELEVLELVARGDRSGEIAEVLGIAAKTVNIHVHNIYRKLHVNSRTEAAKKFFGLT